MAVPDFDDRPWERPPDQRRDIEPHRGQLLLVLATLGVACGWLSCCLVVPAFLGFPLALSEWRRVADGADGAI